MIPQAAPLAAAGGVQFSIIIPTRDRWEHLAACLRAVSRQEFPRSEFEVIVVDDASRLQADGAALARSAGIPFEMLRMDSNGGPAAARNHGAARGRGEYLVFLDDDCAPEPEWLARIAECARGNPACAIGGAIRNGRRKNLCAEAGLAILDAVYRHYNPDPANAGFLVTANLAVPAADFRELGGFNPAYRTSEDRDFCARWRASGRRLVYASGALVLHYAADSLAAFWRRHYHYGRGAYRFRRERSLRSSSPLRLESAGFYRRLLGAPLCGGITPRAALLCLLVLLSQAASAAGFLAEFLSLKREPGQPGKGSTA